MSRYVVDGRTYPVDLQATLGSGSEGRVIPHPNDSNLCIKLFHPVEPGDQTAIKIAQYRGRKVAAICNMRSGLPGQFTLPIAPALDPKDSSIIGYKMRRVPPGFHKLMKLLDGSFRTSHQVGLKLVSELFADLFEDLAMVHSAGSVVGDVNLGCIMFQPGGERAWVDTDSWSYPGFPCLATTEMFAHPDLYSNLQTGSAYVAPLPHHDRFAFLVALTMTALPGAHPFRMGTHPTVRGLQNRAKAGITIFDPDVKVPAMLGAFDVLSDEVLNALIERLKRQTGEAIDPTMLRTFAEEIVTCNSCGSEHHSSRRHCPKCKKVAVVQMPTLASYLIEALFNTIGSLLFAQFIGTDLYLVYRTTNEVKLLRLDENGTTTAIQTTLPTIPGARYRFFQNYLVVCPKPDEAAPATLELYRIDGDTLSRLANTSTGALEGEGAVFGTSSRFLYRTASNAIVRTEPFGQQNVMFDSPVAEVHQRQSWFTVDHTTNADREVLFGYDRALRHWQWFIIHGNTKGSRYQYHDVGDLGLRTGETVEDFAVYFSASSVLVVMQTSYQGRDYIRYATIGLDGTVHINRTIDPNHDSYPYWSALRGKLYQGRSVLHVTPDGIVKQNLTDEACTLLGDTTGHVTAEDQLIRLPGAVGIVRRRGVLTLKPK